MDFFEVSLDHERKLVLVKATGELLIDDGKKIITNARKTAAEYSYDMLYDIRQAYSKVSFADWFFLPRKLDVLKSEEARCFKAAILISPDDAVQDYKMYEIISDNLGLKTRFFFDESEALSWLKEKTLQENIPPEDESKF